MAPSPTRETGFKEVVFVPLRVASEPGSACVSRMTIHARPRRRAALLRRTSSPCRAWSRTAPAGCSPRARRTGRAEPTSRPARRADPGPPAARPPVRHVPPTCHATPDAGLPAGCGARLHACTVPKLPAYADAKVPRHPWQTCGMSSCGVPRTAGGWEKGTERETRRRGGRGARRAFKTA